MSDKKNGKILRPPRFYVNRAYIKSNQPEVIFYEPEPLLIPEPLLTPVPKAPPSDPLSRK